MTSVVSLRLSSSWGVQEGVTLTDHFIIFGCPLLTTQCPLCRPVLRACSFVYCHWRCSCHHDKRWVQCLLYRHCHTLSPSHLPSSRQHVSNSHMLILICHKWVFAIYISELDILSMGKWWWWFEFIYDFLIYFCVCFELCVFLRSLTLYKIILETRVFFVSFFVLHSNYVSMSFCLFQSCNLCRFFFLFSLLMIDSILCYSFSAVESFCSLIFCLCRLMIDLCRWKGLSFIFFS